MCAIVGYVGPAGNEGALQELGADGGHRVGSAGRYALASVTAPVTAGDRTAVLVGDLLSGSADALAADGVAALGALQGSWAAAIWDDAAATLTLARDRFGTLPLYLARAGETTYVAGSIAGILAAGAVDRAVDERTLARFLRFGMTDDTERTFYAGIEQVRAGECVVISAAGITRQPLVQPPTKPTAFAKALEEAVTTRAGEGVGVVVDGALETATLAAFAPQAPTYALKLSGAPVSGSGDQSLEPSADTLKKDLEQFVRVQQEPVVDAGAYIDFFLKRAVGGGGVLLRDTGAHDLLAGGDDSVRAHLRGQGVVGAARSLTASPATAARLGKQALAARRKGAGVPVEQLLSRSLRAVDAGEAPTTTGTTLAAGARAALDGGALAPRLRAAARNSAFFGVTDRHPYLDDNVVAAALALSDSELVVAGRDEQALREAARGKAPGAVVDGPSAVEIGPIQREWFTRLKSFFYGIFLSEEFANRPYVDQSEVLHAFEGWIKGTNPVDSATFWRFVGMELWLREFFDEKPDDEPAPVRIKTDLEPNEGKSLGLTTSLGEQVSRFPLRTDLVDKTTDIDAYVAQTLDRFFATLAADAEMASALADKQWYYFISEKIIAITQGRSYFIWDIEVGRPARVLSKYVTRTPAGIGLGSPFTMQLAIQEAGLSRVLFASAGGAVGKVIGRKGLFYELVGNDIRAIDGPTEYSAYPSNVSAKLAPKDPNDVAARISAMLRDRLPEPYRSNFAGTIVMDANDIGRNVLGADVSPPWTRFEEMFADNPLGQGSEQTPMAVVFVH
ncbi:asparagine synthase-related protein [Calidifontibacter terrae]